MRTSENMFTAPQVYELLFYMETREDFENVIRKRCETKNIKIVAVDKDKIFYQGVQVKIGEEHFRKTLRKLLSEARKREEQNVREDVYFEP